MLADKNSHVMQDDDTDTKQHAEQNQEASLKAAELKKAIESIEFGTENWNGRFRKQFIKPISEMDAFFGVDITRRTAETSCLYFKTTVKNKSLKVAIKVTSEGLEYNRKETLHIGVRLLNPHDDLVLTLARLQKKSTQSFCFFEQPSDRSNHYRMFDKDGQIIYGISDLFPNPFDPSCQAIYMPSPTIWIQTQANTICSGDGPFEVNCQYLRWLENDSACFYTPSTGVNDLPARLRQVNKDLAMAKEKQTKAIQQTLSESQSISLTPRRASERLKERNTQRTMAVVDSTAAAKTAPANK